MRKIWCSLLSLLLTGIVWTKITPTDKNGCAGYQPTLISGDRSFSDRVLPTVPEPKPIEPKNQFSPPPPINHNPMIVEPTPNPPTGDSLWALPQE